MDKKRISVTANADAIILKSKTKCYEGRFTHEGIVVTVEDRKDNIVKELVKELTYIGILFIPTVVNPIVTIILLVHIILPLIDINYIDDRLVGFLYSATLLSLTLCEYVSYFIVMCMYSTARKNKITAGLKLEILLNEFLTYDYIFSPVEFEEKMYTVLISAKNTKISTKSTCYTILIAVCFATLLSSLLFDPSLLRSYQTVFIVLTCMLGISFLLAFEVFSVNSFIVKLELKCCTTEKLYIRYVNLATAIAQKYFETEYPEKFSKN